MNFEKLLRDNTLKATPQRLEILSLMEECGHISIDDLYLKVSNKFPSISLATLYKNINIMSDVSIIKEVKISQIKSRYEIKKEPHAHLICSTCKEVMDIDVKVEHLFEELSKKSGYDVQSSELLFSGICPHCQELSSKEVS